MSRELGECVQLPSDSSPAAFESERENHDTQRERADGVRGGDRVPRSHSSACALDSLLGLQEEGRGCTEDGLHPTLPGARLVDRLRMLLSMDLQEGTQTHMAGMR